MSSRFRRPLLDVIFRQMPRHLVREQARTVDAIVDWRIRGGRAGRVDRYQIAIRDGRCRVNRNPIESPRATIEVDAVDFLRLAAGLAQGPELFMSGKLKIDGDLMFTASLPSLFRIPSARG
jgi:putative sterol carrier protein